jgi:hypothetical protein
VSCHLIYCVTVCFLFLTSARVLVEDLSENLLWGHLPDTAISSMKRLIRLSISRKAKSGRKLEGTLPSLTSLPALSVLELDGNEFTGSVPSDFLNCSSRIARIDISNNQLIGAPLHLTAGPGVSMEVDSMNNYWLPLSGPPYIDQRGILLEFYKATGGNTWTRNYFWASEVDICDWYGVGCSEGQVILLNTPSTNLTGTLPAQVYQLPKLQMLWLSNNPALVPTLQGIEAAATLWDVKFDGTGLQQITGMERAHSVTSLDLSNTKLDGTLPAELLTMRNLRLLSVSNCSMHGELPNSFSTLPYLRTFNAAKNRFTGLLPSFSDSVALSSINLAHNELKGPIPNDFMIRVARFNAMQINLRGNLLTGPLPEEWRRFDRMELDVQQNRIDTIPGSLCERDGWNRGQVGTYGCNALACPPGQTNQMGRQCPEYPVCVPCKNAPPYFGQTDCAGPAAASAASIAHQFAGARLLLIGTILMIVSIADVLF